MPNTDTVDESTIPELAGWLSLPVAAEMTGLSRQHLHRQVSKGAGSLRNVRQVRGTGARPAAILVREAEVLRLMKTRAAEAGCPECRRIEDQDGARPEECTHAPAEVTLDDELTGALGMAEL